MIEESTHLTDADVARTIRLIEHDVEATLGPVKEAGIVEQATFRRALIEGLDPKQFAASSARFAEDVAEQVQQNIHDWFVDVTWPECPFHHRHPLWLYDGQWTCEESQITVCKLGELRTSIDGDGRYSILVDPDPIAIRRAEPEDAAAIATVHVASWRTTYPGIVDQAYIDRLNIEDRRIAWDRRLRDTSPSRPDVLVAISPARGIVGFISGGPVRTAVPGFDAELHAIYLLERVQKAGLGRRLVRAWAKVARVRGFRAAVVGVLASNPARHFYERLGARHVRDDQVVIGEAEYSEIWYGWDDVRLLVG